MKNKFSIALSLAVILSILLTSLVLASDVATAIVDATAPEGSVTLNPGGTGAITINLSVTGRQENPASFQVYRTWTLSGGTFTGSNPQTFNVPARTAHDDPTLFSTSGTVSVDSAQGAGTFTLAVGAINIVTSAPAALGLGASSNYEVTVEIPTPADTAAPNINCTPPTDSMWYGSDVSVPCTASDSESGLANPADANFSLSTSVAAGTETAGAATDTRQVCDNAGNCLTAGPYVFKVDKKAPTNIDFVGGGITEGGSYYFGFVPAGPSDCTADDGGSGLDSCNVTGGGTDVGLHSYTATATDNVGNSDTATLSYTVLAWTLSGFYQPVDMNGVWNTVKGGSTVPFKFEIFAGLTELKLTSYVTGFSATPVLCPSGNLTTDAIEVTATGGTGLRFDTTGDQFIYNWQTPKKPGACYEITMTAQDGSTLSAKFILK